MCILYVEHTSIQTPFLLKIDALYLEFIKFIVRKVDLHVSDS